jgi:hypothetical protein
MTLRYGLRTALTRETDEHYPDEILHTVRRLLTRARDRGGDLDWTSFAAMVYRDGDTPDALLVVEVEIAEVAS